MNPELYTSSSCDIELHLQEKYWVLAPDMEFLGLQVEGEKGPLQGCHEENVAMLTGSPDPLPFSVPPLLISWKKAPSSFKSAVSSWIFNKDDE